MEIAISTLLQYTDHLTRPMKILITERLIDLIKNHPNNMLVIGDFNLPNIDWSNKTSDKSRRLLSVVEDRFLTQLVDVEKNKYVVIY